MRRDLCHGRWSPRKPALTLEGGGTGVKPCGVGKYCCYGLDDCDCSNSTVVFDLDQVDLFTSLVSLTTSSATATTAGNASPSMILSVHDIHISYCDTFFRGERPFK